MLIGLFLLKSLASAISIGSGFRGGLFFASLFMGALLGKLFAYCGPYFADATLTPVIYAVVGMRLEIAVPALSPEVGEIRYRRFRAGKDDQACIARQPFA